MLLEAQLEKQSDNQGTSEEMQQVHRQVTASDYRSLTGTDIIYVFSVQKMATVDLIYDIRSKTNAWSCFFVPCCVQLELQLSQCQSQLNVAQAEAKACKEELAQVRLHI